MVDSNHRQIAPKLSCRCKKCDYSPLERLAGFWDGKADPPTEPLTLIAVKKAFATFLFSEFDEQRALTKVRKAQNKILLDNPDALICPRCYNISEGGEPEARGKAVDCVAFSVLSLPFLQALIWYLGITFNQDLRQQFAMPGIDGGIFFTFLIDGAVQACFAVTLGTLTLISSLFPSRIYRRLLILEGVVGCLCFGLLLKNNWNFEANHCTPYDSCDLISPIAFDFKYCVLYGLPLLWCFVLTCTAFFTRTSTLKRTVS